MISSQMRFSRSSFLRALAIFLDLKKLSGTREPEQFLRAHYGVFQPVFFLSKVFVGSWFKVNRELSAAVRSSKAVTQHHPIMPVGDGFGGRFIGSPAASWERGTAIVRSCPRINTDLIEQASRSLRAYFFCAFECQNEGSLATHSAAGMLNSGRTAKILASGPAADSFAFASVRVSAAVTTNRTPS